MSKKAPAKPTSPRSKRKLVRPKRQELVQYLIRVVGWDYYYALRGGDPKNSFDKNAYEELATLSFSGELIEPRLPKIKRAEVTFSGRVGMLDEPFGEAQLTIGSIWSRAGQLSGYVFTPQQRLAELTSVAQSGRVQIVRCTATKLRYGSALIHSVSIATQLEEDELTND